MDLNVFQSRKTLRLGERIAREICSARAREKRREALARKTRVAVISFEFSPNFKSFFVFSMLFACVTVCLQKAKRVCLIADSQTIDSCSFPCKIVNHTPLVTFTNARSGHSS